MTSHPATARSVARSSSPLRPHPSGMPTAAGHLQVCGHQPQQLFPSTLRNRNSPPSQFGGAEHHYCSAEHLGTSPAPGRLENRINWPDYSPVQTSTAQLLHSGFLKHHRPEAASLQLAPPPPRPRLPLRTPKAGKWQLPDQSPAPPSPCGAGCSGWMRPAALGKYQGNLQTCCRGIRGRSRGQLWGCKPVPRHSPRTRQWVGAALAPRDHLGWPRHLVPWELSPGRHVQKLLPWPWLHQSQLWQHEELHLISRRQPQGSCPSCPLRDTEAGPGSRAGHALVRPSPRGAAHGDFWMFPTCTLLCLHSSKTSRHELSPAAPSTRILPSFSRCDSFPGVGMNSQSPNSQPLNAPCSS